MSDETLVFSAADLSNNDGYIGHLRLVLDLLKKAGHKPRVIGFSKALPLLNPSTITTRSDGLAALTWTAAYFIFSVIFRRPRAVVITAAGAPFNPLIAKVAIALRIPLLFDCQDPPLIGVKRLYGHSPLYPMLGAYLKRGLREVNRASKVTLSVSPGLDAILRRDGWIGEIHRFYNIHNAVSPIASAFSPRTELGWETNPILIYVGGLQPRIRGLEDQVLALRELNSRGLDFRFLVVYGSGEPDFLIDSAGDLIADGTVKLLKNLPPQDVFACLSEADVGVSVAFDFALPSKLFEYAAAGVHIISRATDADVVELFGELIETYDGGIDSMVASLARTETRVEQRFRRRERGQEFIAKLLLENEASIQKF